MQLSNIENPSIVINGGSTQPSSLPPEAPESTPQMLNDRDHNLALLKNVEKTPHTPPQDAGAAPAQTVNAAQVTAQTALNILDKLTAAAAKGDEKAIQQIILEFLKDDKKVLSTSSDNALDMALEASVEFGKCLDAMAKGDISYLQAQGARRQKLAQEAIAKIKKAIANSTGFRGFFLKIFFKVLGLFLVCLSAAATALTAGTLSPLLVASTVLLAGLCALDLCSSISEAAGGPAFDFTTLVKQAFMAMGVSADAAQWIAFAVGLVVTIALSLPAIAPAVGSAASSAALKLKEFALKLKDILAKTTDNVAGDMATASAKVAAFLKEASASQGTLAESTNKMFTLGNYAQSATQFMNGASQVTQGGLQIDSAVKTFEADKALAESRSLQALIAKLQDVLEELIKDLQEALDSTSQTSQFQMDAIKSNHTTVMSITNPGSANAV